MSLVSELQAMSRYSDLRGGDRNVWLQLYGSMKLPRFQECSDGRKEGKLTFYGPMKGEWMKEQERSFR